VDIYILDSGIRYTHQVFGGRASFGGYDEFGGQGEDNHGHGTHCAGLAVGRLTGVAWGARVYRYNTNYSIITVRECSIQHQSRQVIKGYNLKVIDLRKLWYQKHSRKLL